MQLEQALGVPIELSEGVKNKEWFRLKAKLQFDINLPLEERVQQYTDIFIEYYGFLNKLKENNSI